MNHWPGAAVFLVALAHSVAARAGAPTAAPAASPVATPAPPPGTPARPDTGRLAGPADADVDFSVNLWPILESRRLASGARRTSFLELAHRTVLPTGQTHSWHLLNWFQGPDYRVFFPLYYRWGEGERLEQGLIPIFFRRGDSVIVPPLLSGAWETPEGNRTTWITPLWHHTRDPQGRVTDQHLGPWIRWDGGALVLPFYYRLGTGADVHRGVVPLWSRGPGYEVVPPLAMLRRWKPSGARSLWVTPLFHASRDAEGQRSGHCLTTFWGPGYRFVLPFFYAVGTSGRVHAGAVPFFFKGPRYWVAPPLLSGGRRDRDGASRVWITPLFHHARDAEGRASWHFGTVYHSDRLTVVVPLFGATKTGWVAPPLLSWSRQTREGGRDTWVTPLFHKSRDREGRVTSLHAGPYWQGHDDGTLFPLYWWWRPREGGRRDVVPMVFHRHEDARGDVRASVLPPVFAYHRGRELDHRWTLQLHPFLWQKAGQGHEFNFLWRLFSVRREDQSRRVMVGPLWWASREAPDKPLAFQVLGGLFARDVNTEVNVYRYRILWVIPVGRKVQAAPAVAGT